MFPEVKQRSEMYEYPTEELSFVQLLERRRNHWRDILMNRVTNLANLMKTRAANPKLTQELTNSTTKQVERITITQQVAEQREIVMMARAECDTLDEMIVAAKQGDDVFREKFFSDAILTDDLVDEGGVTSPIQKEDLEGGKQS